MTQETKLGLVIGGVFISCFAFILSSAEDGHVAQQQLSALARTGGIPAERIAHTANGRLQLNGAPMPLNQHALATSQQTAHSDSTDDRFDVTSPPPLGQTVVASGHVQTVSPPRQASASDTSPSSPETDAIINLPLHESNAAVVRNKLSKLTQEVNDLVEAPAQVAPEHTGQPVLIYVVVKGDTLTRIARKNYKSNARKYTKRIYEANRHILKSPDAVRPGQELIIPLDDVSAPVDLPDTREYQVRKNDRYATIARRMLGDSKRWREIFELNRDQFPDPHRIRIGAMIKLPSS